MSTDYLLLEFYVLLHQFIFKINKNDENLNKTDCIVNAKYLAEIFDVLYSLSPDIDFFKYLSISSYAFLPLLILNQFSSHMLDKFVKKLNNNEICYSTLVIDKNIKEWIVNYDSLVDLCEKTTIFTELEIDLNFSIKFIKNVIEKSNSIKVIKFNNFEISKHDLHEIFCVCDSQISEISIKNLSFIPDNDENNLICCFSSLPSELQIFRMDNVTGYEFSKDFKLPKSVVELDIRNFSSFDDKCLLSISENNPDITCLILMYCTNISDSKIFEKFTKLRHINIFSSSIDFPTCFTLNSNIQSLIDKNGAFSCFSTNEIANSRLQKGNAFILYSFFSGSCHGEFMRVSHQFARKMFTFSINPYHLSNRNISPSFFANAKETTIATLSYTLLGAGYRLELTCSFTGAKTSFQIQKGQMVSNKFFSLIIYLYFHNSLHCKSII